MRSRVSESISRHSLTRHMDLYLDAHRHSETAVARVIDVLNAFDIIVTSATEAAVRSLELPELDPSQELAKVIPLQREYPYPRNNSLPPAS